jgi:hypothetical protein
MRLMAAICGVVAALTELEHAVWLKAQVQAWERALASPSLSNCPINGPSVTA